MKKVSISSKPDRSEFYTAIDGSRRRDRSQVLIRKARTRHCVLLRELVR